MLRREFLQRTGLAVSAMSVSGLNAVARGEGPSERESAAALQQNDWTSFRNLFALSRDYVHLATFLLASHPRPVAEAIEKHRKALDENPALYLHEQRWDRDEVVRQAAAEYMGGSADHIALTDSTTMGLGLLYGGLKLEPETEIVSTVHDHYSTQMALRHRAERTGAKVREVALYDDPAQASVDEIVTRTRNAIQAKTRVLAVTWVHSSTGVKLPIAAMGAAIGEINAAREPENRVLFCVDGVHGFGVEDLSISDMGCDFFVAGTHKWMFGPRGTGVIWGRADAWKRAAPIIPSFGENYGVWLGKANLSDVSVGDMMSPGGFHSFEHRWALTEAFQFHLAIGKARIEQRIHQLNSLSKEAMSAMRHVKLHTPKSAALSSGIICFEVEGRTPREVVEHLRSRGIIASTTPYRESYARIAPSLLNNEEEIERTMEALRALA